MKYETSKTTINLTILVICVLIFNVIDIVRAYGIEDPYVLRKQWGPILEPLGVSVIVPIIPYTLLMAALIQFRNLITTVTLLVKWGTYCAIKPAQECVDADGNKGPLSLGDGQFNGPRGIAVDLDGYVYVTDFDNNRIQKFLLDTPCREGYEITSGVCFITKWGSTGSGSRSI